MEDSQNSSSRSNEEQQIAAAILNKFLFAFILFYWNFSIIWLSLATSLLYIFFNQIHMKNVNEFD